MIDIPAREVTSAKRIVDYVQVKPFVRTVPVQYKTAPRNTLEEARNAVSTVCDSSPGLRGPSDTVPVVDDEIIKRNSP